MTKQAVLPVPSQRKNESRPERESQQHKESKFDAEVSAPVKSNYAHDFSHIRVWNPPVPQSLTSEQPEEGQGIISQSVAVPAPAVPVPATPAPAEQAPAPPAGPAVPACAITTRTLAPAPDGTADTRSIVGVNEEVEMTAPFSGAWTATGGTLAPATGATVVWTAPAAVASCVVTVTPATGTACTASMTVLPPMLRSLVKLSNRTYTTGLAGSGFRATVTILPTVVSFTRTEFREEAVNAVASGYYDTVLGLNGAAHPVTNWISPNARNSGLVDTIGTIPPGVSGPFSAGHFLWPIPQSFRTAGSSATGSPYSVGLHIQHMIGTTGEETTSKEGATRTRTP